MLNDAFANIYQKESLLLWPGLAIGVTVTAFSLLGNSLRDALEGARAGRKARRAARPPPAAARAGRGRADARGRRHRPRPPS